MIDTDPRQIAHIEKHTGCLGGVIELLRHDLRDPLPDALRKAFESLSALYVVYWKADRASNKLSVIADYENP